MRLTIYRDQQEQEEHKTYKLPSFTGKQLKLVDIIMAQNYVSEALTNSRSPWLSINDMLIQNKCWLCQESFPRGKVKKVFQITHLLDFFQKRFGLESQQISVPPLQSKYLRLSYERYAHLASKFHGEQFSERLLAELAEYDVEVWMSGLTCDISQICRSELRLFLDAPEVNEEARHGNTNNGPKKQGSDIIDMMTFANKECPPGCNCDNPWPFLS